MPQHRFFSSTGAFSACFLLGFFVVAAAAPAANAQESLIGIAASGTQLFRFNSNTPGTFSSLTGVAGITTTITGLQTSDTLVSIDFRPSTSVLYGLAYGNGSERLYTISATGTAVLQSTLSAVPGNDGAGNTTPAQALLNKNYRIDFNPVADALRIVDGDATASSANYRITAGNLTTGLAFSDASINGRSANDTFIGGIAYSNNVAGATSTTLFDVLSGTTGNNTLYTQAPANSGTLVLPAGTSQGNTGAVLLSDFRTGDMDISGVTGLGYYGGDTGFFQTNLTTGAAIFVGNFHPSLGTVRGIAAPVGVSATAVTEPGSIALALPALAMVGAVVIRRRKTTK